MGCADPQQQTDSEEKSPHPDLLLLSAPTEVPNQQADTSGGKARSPVVSVLKPRLRLKRPSPSAESQAEQHSDSKSSTQQSKLCDTDDASRENGGKQKGESAGESRNRAKNEEEMDAPIEEHVILQMPSEETARRLVDCLADGDPSQTLKLTFLDQRHATFYLDGEEFEAVLHDLPCIIESQKAYDDKQFNKVADICQILVVKSSDEPEEGTKGTKDEPTSYAWTHGITPPLWSVKKRRFCKRPSRSTMEEIECNIIQLLEADNEAEQMWFEMSNDEVQHPTKKIKKIEPTAEVSNVDMVASAEDKDEIQNEEPIDPIDAAIEEALVGQEVLATTEQEAQDNSAGDDESVEGAYDARARSLSEDSTINSQDNLQEEIKDEEQRHQTLERIEVLKGEIADLERKLSGFQSRLSEQINPIMKNRFEEIIKRLNINIDDKKTELAELHATLGNRASG